MNKVVVICKECKSQFTEWLSFDSICPECEGEVTPVKDEF